MYLTDHGGVRERINQGSQNQVATSSWVGGGTAAAAGAGAVIRGVGRLLLLLVVVVVGHGDEEAAGEQGRTPQAAALVSDALRAHCEGDIAVGCYRGLLATYRTWIVGSGHVLGALFHTVGRLS